MPIYEYQCEDCGKVCEFLEKSIKSHKKHKCPACGGAKLTKLLSGFSTGKGNHGSLGGNSCSTGTCPFS
ncbi:MAG: zinc ribbon domain-containing protein [Planctomycetes bacterium]|nr:zinc ribbon domain-containing protein [Planctomycetota bacterium]